MDGGRSTPQKHRKGLLPHFLRTCGAEESGMLQSDGEEKTVRLLHTCQVRGLDAVKRFSMVHDGQDAPELERFRIGSCITKEGCNLRELV